MNNKKKIKKMETLLEKLTILYCDSVEILETDDNDASKAISIAESSVQDEIEWLRKAIEIDNQSEQGVD
tara:strand:- start:172 stop:378 length:207 start_codon:yes stop_codon:yes gene_type:complete